MNINLLVKNTEDEKMVLNLRKEIENAACGIFQDSVVEHIYVKEKKDMEYDIKLILSERPKKRQYLKEFEDRVINIYTSVYPDSKGNLISAEVDTNAFLNSGHRNLNISKDLEPKMTNTEGDGISKEDRASQFTPKEPKFDFDSVILNTTIKDRVFQALNVIKYQDLINEQWGLKAIKPNASAALNFYGPSGTGKTMAAEAVASYLGKKILIVSSADMESKFHGESQKNVQALFYASQLNDAVLFFDEADSFLSKRSGNPTNSSDQSMNQTRSQFLIELENFKGIAIFATNLCSNYDEAFKTRLINVQFELPDDNARKQIWSVHTRGMKGLNIPLAEDVNTDEIAVTYKNFSGRDIRNAVYQACCSAAPRGIVAQNDFLTACNNISAEKVAMEAEKAKKEKVNKEIKELIKKSKKTKIAA